MYRIIVALISMIVIQACKIRASDSSLEAISQTDTALVEEFGFLSKMVRDQRPLREVLNFNSAFQARSGKELQSLDVKGNRAEIETNFGPSAYMEGKLYVDFSGSKLEGFELVALVKSYLGSNFLKQNVYNNHILGYKPLKLGEKELEVDPAILEKIKNSRDTAPGFRDGFGDGLSGSPSPFNVPVKGTMTEITDKDGIIWQVKDSYSGRVKGIGYKLDPRPKFLANVFHKFVRYVAKDLGNDLRFNLGVKRLENPHLGEEKLAWTKITSNHSPAVTVNLSVQDVLSLVPKGNTDVLLVPDIHNSSAPLFVLKELIASHKWNWLGLEAPADCQDDIKNRQLSKPTPCLDEFIKNQGSQTREWFTETAKQKFESFGKNFFKDLLDFARAHNVAVYFNDATRAYKGGWPFNDLLAFKTRNFLFANKVPQQGNGIIFGGLWHFNDEKDNVQDFLGPRSNIYLMNY